MIITQIPFREEGDRIVLTGPVFLSCGCGNVIAKYASVAQNLSTRLPQAKPKSSKMVTRWLVQEKMSEKYPILKQHQYGVVVAETEKGFECVDIMTGAAPKVAEQIGQLLRRSAEWTRRQLSNN